MKTSYRLFSLLAGALLITGTALGDEVGSNRTIVNGQPAHAEKAVAGEYDVDRDILYEEPYTAKQPEYDMERDILYPVTYSKTSTDAYDVDRDILYPVE